MAEKFFISSFLYICGSLAILIFSYFCEEKLRDFTRIFTIVSIILILNGIALIVHLFNVDETSSVYLISTLQTLAAIVPILIGLIISKKETSLRLDTKEHDNYKSNKELEALKEKNLGLMEINNLKDQKNMELEQKIMELTGLIEEKDSKILELVAIINSHSIYGQNLNNVNNLFGSIILHMAEENIEYCFVYMLRAYNKYKVDLHNLDQNIDSQQFEYLNNGYKLILVKLTLIIQMIVLFAAEKNKAEELLFQNVVDADLMNDLLQKLDDFKKYDRQMQDM